MKKLRMLFVLSVLFACSNNNDPTSSSSQSKSSSKGKQHWKGSFTNGMKKTYISFAISEDGKELENLTFTGYWRCDGKLEQTTMGPAKNYLIEDGKVNGHITEPEDGGATAVRYELEAVFDGDKAEGNFRMNINALGCDTYKLTWIAERE